MSKGIDQNPTGNNSMLIQSEDTTSKDNLDRHLKVLKEELERHRLVFSQKQALLNEANTVKTSLEKGTVQTKDLFQKVYDYTENVYSNLLNIEKKLQICLKCEEDDEMRSEIIVKKYENQLQELQQEEHDLFEELTLLDEECKEEERLFCTEYEDLLNQLKILKTEFANKTVLRDQIQIEMNRLFEISEAKDLEQVDLLGSGTEQVKECEDTYIKVKEETDSLSNQISDVEELIQKLQSGDKELITTFQLLNSRKNNLEMETKCVTEENLKKTKIIKKIEEKWERLEATMLNEVNNILSEIQITDNNIKCTEEAGKKLNQQIVNLGEKVDSMKLEIDSIVLQFTRPDELYEENLKNLQGRIAEQGETLEELNKKNSELTNTFLETVQKLCDLQSEIENNNSKLQTQNKEVQEHEDELRKVETSQRVADESVAKVETSIKKIDDQHEELENEISVLKQKREETRMRCKGISNEIIITEAEIKKSVVVNSKMKKLVPNPPLKRINSAPLSRLNSAPPQTKLKKKFIDDSDSSTSIDGEKMSYAEYKRKQMRPPQKKK